DAAGQGGDEDEEEDAGAQLLQVGRAGMCRPGGGDVAGDGDRVGDQEVAGAVGERLGDHVDEVDEPEVAGGAAGPAHAEGEEEEGGAVEEDAVPAAVGVADAG